MKLVLLFFFLLPSTAQAKLLVIKNQTEGASNVIIDDKDNATIFGGTAFNSDYNNSECFEQEPTGDDIGLFLTCNSCTDTLQSCNPNRISELGVLKISFIADTAPNPGPVLVTTEQGIEIAQSSDREQQQADPNQSAVAYVDWEGLCELDDNNTCSDASGTITIKVGIDSNEDGKISTEEGGFVTIKIQNPNKDDDANISSLDCLKAGVCDFKIFSGNEKAFIGQIKKSSSFPNWKGSVFNKLKIFYSSESFQNATPLSSNLEISIGTNITLDEEFIIAPLINNTQYYFRVAVVDKAKNIAFITSDEQIQNACGGTGTLTASQCEACPYCTKPANVVGILTKDLNCFISTATYGSSQAPLVKLFREFRNKILLKFKAGIWLTKFYYKWGSQASLVLEKYPIMKIFSGLILTPLAILAWISLHFSYFLIFLSILLLLIGLKKFLKKPKIISIFSILIFFTLLNYPVKSTHAKNADYKKDTFALRSKTTYLSAKYEFYSIQIGPYTPLNLEGDSASYTDVYGSTKNLMLLLSYEKNIFSSFGLLSFELGSGLMATTAYGLKENSTSERSHEKLLFLLVPNHGSLIYRFQYKENPWISPYIKAGITAFGILESPQSSGAQVKLALAPAGHVAAGFGLNIINWSSSKKELYNDYSMHSFLIVVEYKVYKSLSKKFDLSNDMISVGLTFGF